MQYKKILLGFILSAVITNTHALTELAPLMDNKAVTIQLSQMLPNIHYNKTPIDDAISTVAFDNYLDSLDPSKSFLTAADIEQLQKFRTTFDDAIRSGNTQVAYDIYNLYLGRIDKRLNHILENLPAMVANFDYDVEEYLVVDPDEITWAESEEVLTDLWRKRLKNRALVLKMSGQTESQIIESLTRRYRNQLKQVQQTDSTDVFQLFVNSIAAAFDPHTSYFAPKASENFNINMSLSLDGIGAVLQQEDDFTRVVRLVPGGPAAKQGELSANDKIIAVGQDRQNMVDVIGMRLDDVVDMIRGERGTTVKLEIIPALGDGQTSKTIAIVREKVKLEDQSAQKHLIEIEREGQKFNIGVIKLPTFYSDFAAIQAGDRDYKSSTRDTKKLIEELRQENIVGLILDLRGNGGGSLQEANALAGLFIPSGPVVQIRDTSGRVNIMGDTDRSVTYSGPMAILINRMSASASEIVAGALQDYGRSLVLGGQSFGKGTVQVLQELDRGQLKVTQAKFYRVSGESTQHKGVIPDIQFPSLLDENSVGEDALDNPLPWDKIHETRYPVYWDIPSMAPQLQARHEQRIRKEANFIALLEQIDFIKQQSHSFKRLSLKESDRLAQQEKSKQEELTRENNRRDALGLPKVSTLDDIKPVEEDAYEYEAGEILLDFISLNQQTIK